jgi:hypothetical protein
LRGQLDAALEANRITQSEMKNRINELSQKKAKLESEILEMRSETPLRIKSRDDLSTDSDDDHSPVSDDGSTLPYRRRQRLSDPDMFKSMSYNATPPLELFDTNGKPANAQARSPTLHGDDITPMHTGAASTATERYFGRGKPIRLYPRHK